MSFQKLSCISQYPRADTIQFIALKWVIIIYGRLLVKTFLKMYAFFLVFSMVFPCLLPLRKVSVSDYFFKASTLMSMGGSFTLGLSQNWNHSTSPSSFCLTPWDFCSFPELITTHWTFNKLVTNCAHKDPPNQAEWLSVQSIRKLCDHNSKYNENEEKTQGWLSVTPCSNAWGIYPLWLVFSICWGPSINLILSYFISRMCMCISFLK